MGRLTSRFIGPVFGAKVLPRALIVAGIMLLSGFLGGFFYSGSAYAASYLTVSSGSGEDLSFGKVSPNATGVSATTTDTLTINTNCSVGYSVYVSAQSGKGTSLVNTDPNITSNNTIATSSAGISSPSALSNNTWGLSADSTSATTGQYVGLPTYANALTTPLTTRSDVAEQSTVPIYYGLKVTTALAPGTYTGDILYTVLASPACDVYAIHFNANGGTGTMGNQIINVGTATPLDANTFTRNGYVFIGWSDRTTGKTGTATNGIGTAADVDYTDGQSVTDITNFNNTKELYAIWTPISGNMQSWSGNECLALSEGQQIYLKDTRDSRIYAVKKLPDGKCWMMQNLTIGMDGAKTLTSADTNINDGKTYYLPPAGKQGSSTIDDSSTLTATDTTNFRSSEDQHAKTRFRTKNTSITNDSDTGYYNFYTATLGFSYYNDGKTSDSSTRDICPKGWRLPKTTDDGDSVASGSPAEFTTLAKTYNPSASWTYAATSYNYNTSDSTIRNSMHLSAASPLATSTQNNYAGFSYAGFWSGTNTSASYVGSYGRYWSSSVYSTNYGYYLYFNSSYIYPQDYNNKYYGLAVRCVAKDPTMQDFDASTSLPNVGDQMELEDTRDHRTYTVKRLPDGKVWMIQNLALGMDATETGLTLTSADTNIDNNTTYYLPPAGKQGSSTIDQSSTLTATTAANFGTSNDNRAKTQFRAKDSSIANDSDTGYYNFYTATLGYSYYQTSGSGAGKSYGSSTRDICPKGWRMPKTPNTKAESVSSDGPDNDFTYLAKSYNSSASWSNAATASTYSTTDSTIHTGILSGLASASNNYAGFSFSGVWSGTSSSASSVGSRSDYWSASILAIGYGRYMTINSTTVSPQEGSYKYVGRTVRCLAKEPTMQDFDASTSLPNVGDQTTLTDSRDGRRYTVKRLPDGKVWMTQNLAIGMNATTGLTLTSANTNIDNSTTYYLPPPGKQGSSTIDQSSTLTATTTANFTQTAATDKHAKTFFWAKNNDANSSDTGYYNFYTATLGYSSYVTSGSGAGVSTGTSTRDICPKGWRLPKVTDSGSTVSSGSPAEFTVLAKSYNSNATWTGTETSSDYTTDDTTIHTGMHLGIAAAGNNYAGFSYSGYADVTSTTPSNIGFNGRYWSASIAGRETAHGLVFKATELYVNEAGYKSNGRAVRCLAKI